MIFSNSIWKIAVYILLCFPLLNDNIARSQTTSFDQVNELANLFNEDDIQYNNNTTIIGNDGAKITGVLVIGLSYDSHEFMKSIYPRIVSKYIDSGILKLIVLELPLTWHDVQAFAGFRCIPSDKYWSNLQLVIKKYPYDVHAMKKSSILKAPDYIWRMMEGSGISREQAEKCMRNSAIIGYVEAMRRITRDGMNVEYAPSIMIGDKFLGNPSSFGLIEDMIESTLKGGAK